MAERTEPMAGAKFQVTYDGAALTKHVMDVHYLAPALLSLGDLIREANNEINGGRSKVNLLVHSDFEHGCFNINLELVQTLFEQVKQLIDDESVKSAKDILEWIGLIGGPVTGSLLLYLKIRKGRRVEEVTEIKDTDKSGMVSVRFEGDSNHVEIHQHVYNLGENPKVKRAVAGTLSPLEIEGIDTLKSKEEGQDAIEIKKDEARDIKASCGDTEKEIAHEPQEVVAHLRVFGPVFDASAPRWRFEYGQERIYVDISETSIAKDAISRGGVFIGETYKVQMQITEHETPTGKFRNEYKVLEVLSFIPAPQQDDLFLGLPDPPEMRKLPLIEDKSEED